MNAAPGDETGRSARQPEGPRPGAPTPSAEPPTHESIADRYRRRADDFEAKIAAVSAPALWQRASPCADWTARDVVGHVIDMHGVMLRPFRRGLSPAPSLKTDPLGAFRAARADVEAVLENPVLAATPADAPVEGMTAAEHIDQVVSDDLVVHGWDLARATGQDSAMHPGDVRRIWEATSQMPPEELDQLRTPEAFGPGVIVFGPEVLVPADAPLPDRLLGMLGRDPHWSA
ncbi:maleylpyruvate isomerase family mycothiol-dependent enzyme [Streptomyces sp. NPDC006879]|uniref:maleylpyruvate isomerase family mycothiol-dependent enzyme n=1 Tax=Streptomyces sp. NPDC006879 TaxID=3364767 RepID=UPI0036D10072